MYVLAVVIDSPGLVPESNEGDNIIEKKITVNP
jgi:hypothetical protein